MSWLKLLLIMLTINGQPANDISLEARDFAEWNPVEFACVPFEQVRSVRLLVGHDDLGLPTTTPFDQTWRWVWQPRGVAGTVHGSLQITFNDERREQHDFKLNLHPRLLDQQTWHDLIGDVSRLARSVATHLGGAAFAHATLVPLSDQTTPLEEAFALLQRHVATLEHTSRQIFAQALSQLRPQVRRAPFGTQPTIIQPTSDLIRDVEPLDDPATPILQRVRDQLGGVPQTITTRQPHASFDTPEHRWLVGLIELIERRLRRLRGLVEEEHQRQSRPRLAQLAAQIEHALHRLRTLRNEPILHGIPARRTPPQSQRMIRDHRYRRLVRLWRELRQTPMLTLEVGALALPIHDLPTLYEQWCALIVAEIVAQSGAIISQTLLHEDVERERWTLNLNTFTPLLEIQHDDGQYHLRYQARYTQHPDEHGLQSLDGYMRIPDLVIERIKHDQVDVLVLDAKYRRANDGRAPQDALDDAYAYRGSIGKDGASRVIHAAILFPATAHAADFGTVSALPTLPNYVDAVRDVVGKFLDAT